MNIKSDLSQEYINECFEYEDGYLRWKIRPREHFKCNRGYNGWNMKYSGKICGGVCDTGYPTVMLDKKIWKIHRLIWILLNGQIPEGKLISHIDGNNKNNRIENLRIINHSSNSRNKQKYLDRYTSQYKGVCWDKAKQKFCARLGNKHLGYFINEIDAAIAWDNNVKQLNDPFWVTNF